MTVRIAGHKVTVFNVHLLPPRDLQYFGEARWQFADLLDALEREEGPVIVAGDFNFTAQSANASVLKRAGLREVHDLAGWGRGATWPVMSYLRRVPGLRIDHIFLGAGLTCLQATTGEGQGSDHRPVIAELSFPD